MRLRPIAFRIRNYKSIRDSGVCTLSSDGITALAGQNEAGKSSVLEALDDFNMDPGKPSLRKDFVPDQRPESVPNVGVLFRVDWEQVSKYLVDVSLKIDPIFWEALTSTNELWLYRTPSTGALTISAELAKHWPKQEVPAAGKEVGSTAAETTLAPAPVKYATWSQLSKALWEIWPFFIYFDSFDDVLPREVEISLVVVSSAMQEPELPQSVKDFLTLSGIDLSKVRDLALKDNEKQLRNYLNSKSAEVTGEFHNYWRQTHSGEQRVVLRAEHFRREGGLYLSFYADDGVTMQYPNQRSKGFSWFLAFYLRLSAAVTEQVRLPHFVLIDEPGSFLHQRAQRDILDVLEKRVAKEDIVVYSTHSPYMLPPEKMYRVRVVAKDKKGETFIADRLTDPRIQRDDKGDALSPVMAAIGLDISAGSHTQKEENVIVEGISDYYYLLAWGMVLESKIFNERGIIPARGTKNIPTLVSLCIAWSRRFVILVDRDDAGQAIRNDLIKTMNITPESIVTFQQAFAIEDLFTSADFASLVALTDGDYKMNENERPTAFIKRKRADKVLIARRFAEAVSVGELDANVLSDGSVEAARKIFNTLHESLKIDPLFRVSSPPK